jgi:glycosyltransferase involved in cell wall biosynthesis
MAKRKISVLIPSRLEVQTVASDLRSTERLMLERAIESICSQTMADRVDLQILAGVDLGSNIPSRLTTNSKVRFVESHSRSQAAALNAAAKYIDGDVVAILEDDDQWHPVFLGYALNMLEQSDFVSSTQLEVSPDNNIIRIFDFPTPSGWVMKRKTWEAVGNFNESYRWHLDNEWLARLAENGATRVHLVEASAPIELNYVDAVRPQLAACLRHGGPNVRLARHSVPWPLVKRLVHPKSGLARIVTDPTLSAESKGEFDLLFRKYGRIPW